MNVKAIERTRDMIAAHFRDFYQAEWVHPCGTPACVAGFACAANGGRLLVETVETESKRVVIRTDCKRPDGSIVSVSAYAREVLGLSHFQSEDLFYGMPFDKSKTDRSQPTHRDAVATLNHLIETDEVRWQRAPAED